MLLTQPYRFQSKDAEFLAAQFKSRSDYNMGFMLASEQGCGKTLTILRTLDLLRQKIKVLICCPAGARNEWKRQIEYHYSPGSFSVFIARSSKDILAFNAGTLKREGFKITGIMPAAMFTTKNMNSDIEILVTGYHTNLLKQIDQQIKFDVVVLDECQEISNPKSETSQEIEKIVNRCDSYLLPLSGTPAKDKPEQIWNAARLCQPLEWGSDINNFRFRYLQKVPNQWAPEGYYLRGLKPERAKELETRLSKVMLRRTKKEVAPFLPPLIVMLRHVPVKKVDIDWDNPESFKNFCAQNIEVKVEETINILNRAVEHDEKRFVVFCHLDRTAQNLEAEIVKHNFKVVNIHGATPDSRHRKVDIVANATEPSVLIASIEGSGTAVDFTWCTTGVFAEQHHVPGETSQAAQRFHRLSSTFSTNLWFVVGEGTKEEQKAEAYIRKQKDLEKVYAGGEFEDKATEVLDIKDKEGLGDLI